MRRPRERRAELLRNYSLFGDSAYPIGPNMKKGFPRLGNLNRVQRRYNRGMNSKGGVAVAVLMLTDDASNALDSRVGTHKHLSENFASAYGSSNTVKGPKFKSIKPSFDTQKNGSRRSATIILVGYGFFRILVPPGIRS